MIISALFVIMIVSTALILGNEFSIESKLGILPSCPTIGKPNGADGTGSTPSGSD
jgi:hypothetical protein